MKKMITELLKKSIQKDKEASLWKAKLRDAIRDVLVKEKGKRIDFAPTEASRKEFEGKPFKKAALSILPDESYGILFDLNGLGEWRPGFIAAVYLSGEPDDDIIKIDVMDCIEGKDDKGEPEAIIHTLDIESVDKYVSILNFIEDNANNLS